MSKRALNIEAGGFQRIFRREGCRFDAGKSGNTGSSNHVSNQFDRNRLQVR